MTFHVWIGRLRFFFVCVNVCLMWICVIFCRSKCKFNVKCYNGIFFLYVIEHWLKKKWDRMKIFFFSLESDKVNKTVCKNGKFTLFTKFISHIWLTVIFNFISYYKSRHFAIRFAKRVSCSFSNRIMCRITGPSELLTIKDDNIWKHKKVYSKSASRHLFFFSNVSKNILFSIFLYLILFGFIFQCHFFKKKKYLLCKYCVWFWDLSHTYRTWWWQSNSFIGIEQCKPY